MANIPMDGPAATQGLTERVAAVRAPRMAAYLGGAVSLALLAGAATWGVQLVRRDVSGIPVVRALEGPMRNPPADPGGEIADHTGLSVDNVLGTGLAAPAEAALRLAPQETPLSPADLTAPDEQASPAVAPVQVAASAEMPELQSDDEVQAIVDEILANAGALPLSSAMPAAPAIAGPEPSPVAADADPNAVTITINGNPVQTRRASGAPSAPELTAPAASPLAVASAPRPKLRPSDLAAPRPQVAPQNAPIAQQIPAGTALIQLGAYDSQTVAEAQWAVFLSNFPQLLGGKQHFVQRATSGGKIFYRLRLRGFADMAEARRLCSALKAQQVDCIPAVAR